MSSTYANLFFFIFPNPSMLCDLSFELSIFAVLVTAAFALWVAPGGLAWALYRGRAGAGAGGRNPIIPGPSGLPLCGLLHAFTGPTAHRVLARLAHAFHALPLMAFSVGLTRFVISSNPDTAKEILNSSAFADRPVKESAYELLFHRAMGFAPYGEYWRSLRRISSTYLFSPKRISAFSDVRGAIGEGMVREIRRQGVGEIGPRRVLHFGSLNNVMMSVFGRRYGFNDDGAVLEELVSEGYELLGLFNWSDHFPLLGLLDLQGVRKRCRALVSKVNAFVGNIIEEHRILKRKTNGASASAAALSREKEEGDFVDVLLDLENDESLSESDMIAVLWEMIFRGTDTVAILLEWILARMVLHPDVQSKAQAEIDRCVGGGDGHRPVSDSDLPNLPYLQAIVKETLRVHPPGPLLSWARLAIHDVHIGKNFIPAGTTAMVNMWAITHDENVWSDPNVFKPERFMNENVGIMGTDLRLAPFGAGRRVCPGKAMGLATVHLWLAQLLQNFNWVASDDHGVDLTECLKLSMEMKKPLICKALPRNC